MIRSFSFLLISLPLFGSAQEDLSKKYAKEIDAETLKKHLMVIASDEYAGRETGFEGQKKTEKYLVEQFKKIGLAPGNNGSYVQEFDVVTSKPEGSLTVDDKQYDFLSEFYFYYKFEKDFSEDDIIFAGYGIDSDNYSDYKNLDVEGKIVMILEDEPFDKKGKSLVTRKKKESEWSYSWKKKYETAVKQGAAGMITIVQDYENKRELVRGYLSSPRMSLVSNDEKDELADAPPMIYMSEKLANSILSKKETNLEEIKQAITKTKKSISHTVPVKMTMDFLPQGDRLKSSNVLAFLEGTDKKEEVLIITAHYDHLGKNGDLIFNGADDDGTGTVSLLELAQAFKQAKDDGNGPRRSILFMPVSGEEKGLLGSEYYSENPVYPIEKTVADLNIDMIGRHDTLHNHSNYVYLIGSDRLSSELHEISEKVNKTYTNLELDYTYNEKDDPNQFYYRSDHYNFARKGVPVIFYFSGVHEDYHEATDTVDKIEFGKMTTIARLVFHTAWELANRDEKIKVDQPIEWD